MNQEKLLSLVINNDEDGLKDYDAIYVENRNYYVILNRSKLIVYNNIKNII
ncbi:MAG: hypothetical protein RSE00_05665 [Clostridia bacterium]